MWNGVIVGDMDIGGESTFIVPLQPLFFYNKVYTFFHTLLLQKVCRNGKVFVVNLSIKLKVMTGLEYEHTRGMYVCIGIVILFLIRKVKPFDTIWEAFKIVMMILLIIVTAGMIGNVVKKWFD
jgi:hypothetical protein